MGTGGSGRGFEVTPERVMTAATRDLPEQVAALARIARTFNARLVPDSAFGTVAASTTAASGHARFQQEGEEHFANVDEQLNTMIAGLKLTAAAMQRFDANNANQIQQRGQF